jgi:hypothetical protein
VNDWIRIHLEMMQIRNITGVPGPLKKKYTYGVRLHLAVPGKAKDELLYVGLKHLDEPVFVSEQQNKQKNICNASFQEVP